MRAQTCHRLLLRHQGESLIIHIRKSLEEHFPHSMAKAVVDAASKKGLSHEEMHTKVEYIVVEIMTEL